jgi:hypothetical protein
MKTSEMRADVKELLKRVDEDAKGTRCLTMAEVTLCLDELRRLAAPSVASPQGPFEALKNTPSVHAPISKERLERLADESVATPAQGAPGAREALKDHADWLEQQIALWKRVMSKEAELHNTNAWERASARVTAYKDCLEMLRAAALAQPGAPTKEG